VGVQFVSIGALGAETPARDRRLRITLDGNQLPVLVINELTATYAAVGTHRTRNLSANRARLKMTRPFGHYLGPVPSDRVLICRITGQLERNSLIIVTLHEKASNPGRFISGISYTRARLVMSKNSHTFIQAGQSNSV